MQATFEILSPALMITGFVMIMMLVIEYLNVLTSGNWDRVIARWTWSQSVLCSFLGATPGCLGAYAVASLYMHRVVTVGALTAAMVATSGDEAFVMLALFPRTALLILSALFVSGLITGIVVDMGTRSRRTRETSDVANYTATHPGHPECIPFSAQQLILQWRNCSPHRGWLAFFLVLFLLGVISGAVGHDHSLHEQDFVQESSIEHAQDHDAHAHDADENGLSWDWVRVTLFMLGLVALAIVGSVPDHFLDEHLWDHLVKKHLWRVLLWTLGAVAATHVVVHCVDVSELVTAHRLPLLLAACLVGILPTSGPHLVFVTLYAQGAMPLSILIANCIVQDGHGLLPTLAHSRRAFVAVKTLKFAMGMCVGLVGHAMGW